MIQRSHAGEIAFRPVHAAYQSKFDRVASYQEDDRIVDVAALLRVAGVLRVR
jgi:hypothetical protein